MTRGINKIGARGGRNWDSGEEWIWARRVNLWGDLC